MTDKPRSARRTTTLRAQIVSHLFPRRNRPKADVLQHEAAR